MRCTFDSVRIRVIVFILTFGSLITSALNLTAADKPNANVNYIMCKTGCHGYAAVTVNNAVPTAGYKFKWSDGSTKAFDSALCAGSYFVIVTDSAGGADTVHFTLSSGVHITPITSPYSCAHTCNGAAAVYLPGLSGVTYSWYINGTSDKNTSSNNKPRVCPGPDTVTVNIPGCPSQNIYFNIPTPPVLTATVLTITPTSCANACNGRVTISASGGEGKWSVTWSDGFKGVTDTVLCYGKTYTATVNDDGCYTTLVTVALPPPVEHKIVAHIEVDSSACGCSTYAVVTAVDYAGKPYKYRWSRGDTTQAVRGLCSGTYTVIASGICGSDTEKIVIYPVKAHVSVNTTPSCNCNGTAQAKLVNGGSKVRYKWSTGDTTSFISGLCTGTYRVKAYGPCGSDSTTFTIKPPTHLHLLDTVTVSAGCQGSCTVKEKVIDTGGLEPYHYLWSNGDTSQTAHHLCDGHTYTVIAWDNCKDSTFDTVKIIVLPHKPAASFVPLQYCCPGTSNGIGCVTASVGVKPYTYQWKRGDSTSIARGLTPDSNYTVYITDTCGLKDTFTFTFPRPPGISAMFTNTNYTCPGACTGVGYITTSGGIGPYRYKWNTGNTKSTATGLCTDTLYIVTVTDTCGDTAVLRFKFPYPPKMTINMGYSPTCKGHCVGTAYAYLSGGISPYTYKWSSGDTGSTVYNACHGIRYKVTVTDMCGTTITDTVSVPLAPPLVCTVSVVTLPCPGQCNGVARVTTTGGILPLYYTWSSGSTTTTASNLCGDSTYTVYVNDPGCIIDTVQIKIPKPTPLGDSVFSIAPSCPATCNGTATVKAYGGNPAYTYKWSNGQNKATAKGLCAGKYYVLVSDKCLKVDTLHVIVPAVKITASITTETVNRCYYDCKGKLAVSATGGRIPYKYRWSNGDSSAVDSGLCAGKYSVIVYDSACAYDTVYITVTAPDKLKDSITVGRPALCNGYCNGIANLFVTGGTPPISYIWSDASTNKSDSALCPGYQYVIVHDSGCTSDTIHFTVRSVTQLTLPVPTAKSTSCHDTCDGIISVKMPSGGYPPYTYHWNNGKDSSSVHGMCGGPNILLVKDSLGCFLYDTVNVPRPSVVSLSLDSIAGHCNYPDGKAFVTQTSGGIAPYTYTWDNGVKGPRDSTVSSGWHSIVVEDSNRCIFKFDYKLPGLFLHISVRPDTSIYYCSTISLWAKGAVYYRWWPSVDLSCDTCAAPNFKGLVSRHYCVQGTDSFGCKDTACVDVTIRYDCGVPFLPTAFTPNHDGVNDHFHVLGNCINKVHLLVFNRWGERVFESYDFNQGWDGMYKNQPAPQDVYMWLLEATNYLGESFNLKGDVTLIR